MKEEGRDKQREEAEEEEVEEEAEEEGKDRNSEMGEWNGRSSKKWTKWECFKQCKGGSSR